MYAISVRSYLTAGLAMTTAGVIAFTPAMSQNVAHAPTLPSVSTAEVQLSAVISQQALDDFLAAIQSAQIWVDETVADLLSKPGAVLSDVLATAADLNEQLWTNLADATDNVALQALIFSAYSATNAGITTIGTALEQAGGGLEAGANTITGIITATLAQSLSVAATAVAGIINNPLSLDSYVDALNGTAALIATIVPNAVGGTGDALLQVAGGIHDALGTLADGVNQQLYNMYMTIAGLVGAISTAADSELVDRVLQALQAVTLVPVASLVGAGVSAFNILNDTGMGVVDSLVSGVFYAPADALSSALGSVAYALQLITTAPLDPASYTHALAAVITGGASAVNSLIGGVGEIAKIPMNVLSGVTAAGGELIKGLVSAIGGAAAGLMSAVGLTGVGTAISSLANGINHAVDSAVDAVGSVANTVNNLIDQGVDAIQNLNTQVAGGIANAIVGLTPSSSPAPIMAPMMLSVGSGEVSDDTGSGGATGGGSGDNGGGDPAPDPASTPAAGGSAESSGGEEGDGSTPPADLDQQIADQQESGGAEGDSGSGGSEAGGSDEQSEEEAVAAAEEQNEADNAAEAAAGNATGGGNGATGGGSEPAEEAGGAEAGAAAQVTDPGDGGAEAGGNNNDGGTGGE